MLARGHLDLVRGHPREARVFDAVAIEKALTAAEQRLLAMAPGDATYAKAAEWFLDNAYLLHRAARQIAEDLPPGFEARLPRLASGAWRGHARIDALARAMLDESRWVIDEDALTRFVQAYQDVAPLTIAELWALPAILRATVLGAIAAFLAAIYASGTAPALVPSPTEPGPSAGVERGVRALRILAELDWKRFFEAASRVEAILREDPAGVYDRMDFASCDAYRKAVETSAWATGKSEIDVARIAVELARGGGSGPDGHVGYYLAGAGRDVLDARTGFRASGLDRIRRAVRARPSLSFVGSLAVVTAGILVVVAWLAAAAGAHGPMIAAAVLLTLCPASVVTLSLVRAMFARLLLPVALPKIDYSTGIPDDARTLVAIPALLGGRDEVEELLQRLELHYVGNPDPRLVFALLTDHVDAGALAVDDTLVTAAARGIERLNERLGTNGHRPFHLLHRTPRWNPAEQRFMGWERKRGKLEELNRLLRGDSHTTYATHVGDAKALEGIRFVLTLDADTVLPAGAVHRLVGLLAHPLNSPVLDAEGRVVSGYTIVQPRVSISPSSARESRFARLFSGDVGFDIYTRAVSDVYQDLFGAGIYVGKGLYDVDAFARTLEGRVPENSLASHDLFEGIHGRAALATDIVVFEEYPAHYVAFARRMHRWVRGDWQLLPWLLPRVPSARGRRIPNRLSFIDSFKIVDNLRRSLVAPSIVALLVAGFTFLPGGPLVWTLGALASLFAPVAPCLVRSRREALEAVGRWALGVVFIAHEAALVVDAVVRTLVRMTITRTHLLQWTSAAHTAGMLRASSRRTLHWREMAASPALAVATASACAWTRPASLMVAAPILLAWLVAPEIARWMGDPTAARTEPLSTGDRRTLRLLARRTWLFFEAFVGPADQWLPVDNHQDDPHAQTAHRTSPTNIGMMLLSTLAAYDFGWLGQTELAARLWAALESIGRLERYRHHLFNWYDTRTLEPLLPRYVSTVDSGNLVGALLALHEGCRQVAGGEVLRPASWDGLDDALDVFDEACGLASARPTSELAGVLRQMREAVASGRCGAERSHEALALLCDVLLPSLDHTLIEYLSTDALRHEPEALHALRTWHGRVRHQMLELRRELESQLPWVAWTDDPVARALALPSMLRLEAIPGACLQFDLDLAAWERENADGATEHAASIQRLRDAFRSASALAQSTLDRLAEIGARARSEADAMPFDFLYDPERRLFRIGFNATVDRMDSHHYDLLASEARLASYLAIVRHEVPETHWSALGRPITRIAGGHALVSWGGSMFEYLMPALLMRSQAGTLLADSCDFAVRAQIAHGAERHEPWGVSESAFARMDSHHTYQYRSFGVPGLGLKRGLDDDRVMAPYASVLAVAMRPRAVLDNLAQLTSLGAVGAYGLFEAVDFTPGRAPQGRRHAVVRTYMAHHQGMLLVALDNALHGHPMVARFHADPRVESGVALLNERAPSSPPLERTPVAGANALAVVLPHTSAIAPWTPHRGALPEAHVLGNGRLCSVLTDSGGGGLRWAGLAVTSQRVDPTLDEDGLWIYIRDDKTGRVSLATSAAGRTSFAAHQVEYHLREQGLSVHVEVSMASDADVELRLVTLHNESAEPRSLTLTTAAEPVLLPVLAATRHPAFARLFLECEPLPQDHGVLLSRRPRSGEEPRAVVIHRLVHEGDSVRFAGVHTDRGAFYGRCGSARAPRALAKTSHGEDQARTSTALDPIMSVSAEVTLAPDRTVTLAFVTAVAGSRTEALAAARRFGSIHAVRWAFTDAEHEAARRVQRAFVEPDLLPYVQRLFSALRFADPALRAPRDVLATARPTQRALWGRGISGDEPILLVRVHDQSAPLVREVLAAQGYLRGCGIRLDVVLVDDQASGYLTETAGSLGALLTEIGANEWINRRGGVFLIARDQLGEDERHRLEATARVVLDTRDGSLQACFARPVVRPPELPRFEPTRSQDTPPRVPTVPPLRFDNGFGGFTEDGREYLIRVRPGTPTPAPWCNVLANHDTGCLASESGLGCTWSQNAGENRLTPWRNDPVFDTPSEAVYLRDEETASVWSPTPLPAGGDAETLVRHGAGYTTYVRESHGLEQELTVFVPPDAPLKVVRLRVRNTLARHRRLSATYYAEWVLGSLREEESPYVVPEFDRAHACLLAMSGYRAERGERVAFLAASREVRSVTVDRTEFLGLRGDAARPAALSRMELSGRVEPGLDPCGAIQVQWELGPGEAGETHFVLGDAPDRAAAIAAVEHYREPAAIDVAWRALGEYWDDVLGAVRVATPDPAMDLMLNRWLLYQCLSARVFGRTGYYQSSGAFGFRDQLQDVLALLHSAPQLARAHVLEAASHQFEEGDVLHWWHPPKGRGVRTHCSDDLAWLPFVVCEYVSATGDVAILDARVPFLTADPLRRDEHDRYAQFEFAEGAETLFEHARRALERAVTEGAHGLPLMGDGDWNDGMNHVGALGRGESVWLAWFLFATMTRFASLCERVGRAPDATHWRTLADSLRARVEAVAWDGAWYLRAFHDDGSRIGSSRSSECRIDSIAQSWAVISGAADDVRARRAMQSAGERLVLERERLVLLLAPPFRTLLHDPGYIRAYPPGVRENGGQYTHAATWHGWALATLGDGDGAGHVFDMLNPVHHALTADAAERYRVEPYVLAGDVYGCEPWVGRGGWTWYTGSAAWSWRLGVERILGLTLSEGALRVEPCIPKAWPRFEAWVRAGDETLHVVVENPRGVCRGIATMTVDGTLVESNTVPRVAGGKGVREVRVILGDARATAPRDGVSEAHSKVA